MVTMFVQLSKLATPSNSGQPRRVLVFRYGLLGFMGLSLLGLLGCQAKPAQYGKIDGETMGTTYHISFRLPQPNEVSEANKTNKANKANEANESKKDSDVTASIQASIDQKLIAFNNSLSTWQDDSTISQFNKAPANTKTYDIDANFIKVLQDSKQVHQQSGGAFDPTVKPILELWGFGSKMRADRLQNKPSDDDIAKAKALIDFDSIELQKDQQGMFVRKTKDGVSIDFSAIAKGYAVDVIADVLKSDYHINNYMVEIGGEVATSGVNARGQAWQIAIDAPILHSGVTNRQSIGIIRQPIDARKQGSMHLATSGNYRNSLVFDNVRYSHTIDPTTGSPIVGGAASVTVAANTVALADAWATALTAMPYEKALDMASKQQLAVMFITNKQESQGVNVNLDAADLKAEDWQIVQTDAMQQLRAGQVTAK